MEKYDLETLKRGLKELKIELNEDQIQQFVTYYEVLVEWNSFMNLTAITEFQEVIIKHFLDSLALVNAVDLRKTESVIDIGTGAGFPGIPLKIAYPHLKITLLDSLNKRIKFLNEVIQKLNLRDIETIHGRAEDFAKQAVYREQYDLCVSRAVANLSSLSEYCLPYVKVNGQFIPYKSGNIDEEVKEAKNAIHIMGGNVEKIFHFRLLDTDMERSLVAIKKMKSTPKKYPRKAGLPTKEPIKEL